MRLNASSAVAFFEAEATSSGGQSSPPEPPVRSRQQIDLEPLYRKQAPRLKRFFARRIGVEEAHDLVHECFVGLLRALGRPAKVEQPEAYLSRIASNLAARHSRTAARRSTQLHIPADDAPLLGNNFQAHLEVRDILCRLEEAMLRLPPITREVFMARRIDGCSYKEIAARAGLSVKRVEKHMTRAIAQLDDILSAG